MREEGAKSARPNGTVAERKSNSKLAGLESSPTQPPGDGHVKSTSDAQFWSRFHPYIVLYKMTPTLLSLWAMGLLIYLVLRVQLVIAKVGPTGQIKVHPDSWLFPYEDRADPQWNSFLRGTPSLMALMTLHLLLTHSVDRIFKYSRQARFYVQAIFGVGALCITHGVKGAIVVIFLYALYYGISLLAQYSSRYTRILSWSLTLALCLGNSKEIRNSTWFNIIFGFIIPSNPLVAMPIGIRFLSLRGQSFVEDKIRAVEMAAKSIDNESELYPDARSGKGKDFENGNNEQKQMSFYLEQVIHRSGKLSNYSPIGFLAYVVFLPVYSAGPITTYNAFVHYASIRTRPQTQWVIKKFVSIATMMFCTHMINRLYLPISMSRNLQYWDHLYLLDFNLLVAITLLYIWLKLKTLWDLFRFWSILSGFYVTDNMAEFVFNAYSQRAFWKFWHHSYYIYLSRYIYRPLGGKKSRVLSNICVFGFVAIWHVLNVESLVWFLLTMPAVGFEMVLYQICQAIPKSNSPDIWKHPHLGLWGFAVVTMFVCWTQYIMHGCYVAGIFKLLSHTKNHPEELIGVALFIYLLILPLRTSQIIKDNLHYLSGKPPYNFDFTSSGEPIVKEITDDDDDDPKHN